MWTPTSRPWTPRHPNFVANTGTMDGVRITGGSTTEPDKDIAVEVREDATQFGDALSIYPKKTYSGNLAAIPVHKPEGFDFSKTKGLAVYIKFPTTGHGHQPVHPPDQGRLVPVV